MEIISLIFGILGLVATLFGTALAFVTYVSPMTRFNWYLKNPRNWKKARADYLQIFQYEGQPGFQIVSNHGEAEVEHFQDEWIYNYPDMTHNSSYFVELHANGVFICRELFVTLDGGRGFIPVPNVDYVEDKAIYSYNSLQVMLARVISTFPRGKAASIEEFAAEQKIPIQINGK